MTQAGVWPIRWMDGQVRTSDLENGSSTRHSIYNFDQFEDARSDADHHAGRLAVYSRGPYRSCARKRSINQPSPVEVSSVRFLPTIVRLLSTASESGGIRELSRSRCPINLRVSYGQPFQLYSKYVEPSKLWLLRLGKLFKIFTGTPPLTAKFDHSKWVRLKNCFKSAKYYITWSITRHEL